MRANEFIETMFLTGIDSLKESGEKFDSPLTEVPKIRELFDGRIDEETVKNLELGWDTSITDDFKEFWRIG